MPTYSQLALSLIQGLALLAAAPLVSGFSHMIRARIQCRQGAGLWRDYSDICNLLRRQEILPLGAGRVFIFVPYLMLAVLLLVAMALPIVKTSSPLAAAGDLITVIYLLALSRFVFSLSGIDSGNPFAVTGASRELTMGVLVEPAILLSLVVAGLVAGSTNLGAISAKFSDGGWDSILARMTATLAFAIAMYFEMGKVPFDLAEAEQELQEGPLIEYSGAGLGILRMCLGLKQLLLATLLIGVFLPFGAASDGSSLWQLALSVVIFIVKLVAVFALIGLIENTTARTRFLRVSRSTWAGFAVAALSLVLYAVGI